MAVVLFVAIPTGAAKFFHTITEDPVFLNLMEGFAARNLFGLYLGDFPHEGYPACIPVSWRGA